ncbi:MAG: hypothetical protein ACKORI_02145, partial [Verrucomicrobiota bacterium]
MLSARSLPLGSVRLTNGFVSGGASALSELDRASVVNHVTSMTEFLLTRGMA